MPEIRADNPKLYKDQGKTEKILLLYMVLEEIARAEKKIAEMQQFITRFRAKATKARQAQSRQKQVDKMEMPEVKRTSRRYPTFAFVPARPSGREALTMAPVGKRFGDLRVLEDVGLELMRGDKLAVVGANGIGKTTLLRMIVAELEPDGGRIELGYEVHPGYFSQDHNALANARGNVYDWLYSASPVKEIGTIRGTLGKVLFSGDDASKPLGALSGGEATRLRLAALMLQKPNLLVLDEPTNHLDLEGREALMQALMAYKGTLVFVSHDRHFVSSVATRVLALTAEGSEDFHGSYDEYLDRDGADFLAVDGMSAPAEKAPPPSNSEGDGQEAHAQRKQRKRETARLRKQVERLEKEIAEREREIGQMEERFADKEYYDNSSWEQIGKDERRKEAARYKLDSIVTEWEKAAGELEAWRQEG